jgi:hypothetical protein
MASISEVYGNRFVESASLDKAIHAVKLYATNIAHKQFSFRNEVADMWVKNNMKPEIINALVSHVTLVNANMHIVHVPKTSKDINMFPYLINGPVEYFVVFDTENSVKGKTQLYSIYITTLKMEAY